MKQAADQHQIRARAETAPVAPPASGFFNSQGVTATRVFCASIYCGWVVVVDFDDLGLPNDTPFPEITRSRTWKCQRCRCTESTAMPDWRSLLKVERKDEAVVDLQALCRERR